MAKSNREKYGSVLKSRRSKRGKSKSVVKKRRKSTKSKIYSTSKTVVNKLNDKELEMRRKLDKYLASNPVAALMVDDGSATRSHLSFSSFKRLNIPYLHSINANGVANLYPLYVTSGNKISKTRAEQVFELIKPFKQFYYAESNLRLRSKLIKVQEALEAQLALSHQLRADNPFRGQTVYKNLTSKKTIIPNEPKGKISNIKNVEGYYKELHLDPREYDEVVQEIVPNIGAIRTGWRKGDRSWAYDLAHRDEPIVISGRQLKEWVKKKGKGYDVLGVDDGSLYGRPNAFMAGQ